MTVETFQRVASLIAKYLDIPVASVEEDSGLQDLGLDSLGALELVFEIEEEFKVSVPDTQLEELTTVRAVCDGIEALLKGTPPR